MLMDVESCVIASQWKMVVLKSIFVYSVYN